MKVARDPSQKYYLNEMSLSAISLCWNEGIHISRAVARPQYAKISKILDKISGIITVIYIDHDRTRASSENSWTSFSDRMQHESIDELLCLIKHFEIANVSDSSQENAELRHRFNNSGNGQNITKLLESIASLFPGHYQCFSFKALARPDNRSRHSLHYLYHRQPLLPPPLLFRLPTLTPSTQ
jgi:hypothetical protein